MYIYVAIGKNTERLYFHPYTNKKINNIPWYIYIYIYTYKDHHFIAFNIVNFYPSISYKPLKDARTFAASYTSISV